MRNNNRRFRFIKYISFDQLITKLGYQRILIKDQKVFIMPYLDVTFKSSCD
jgi:hypothetical protein